MDEKIREIKIKIIENFIKIKRLKRENKQLRLKKKDLENKIREDKIIGGFKRFKRGEVE